MRTCRHLLRKGKINIFTEPIRIVNHLGALRCTNCQALEHHVASQCEWSAERENCAQSHHTNECENTEIICINCTREGLNGEGHKASSIDCPTYKKYKNEKLKGYYKSTQASTQQPPSNRYPTTKDLEPNSNYNNQDFRRRNTRVEETRTIRYKNVENTRRRIDRANRMTWENRPSHSQ